MKKENKEGIVIKIGDTSHPTDIEVECVSIEISEKTLSELDRRRQRKPNGEMETLDDVLGHYWIT